ncbi:aminotransferase class V-fold PLP-dependent enzyme, partial [Streptomyces sp. NPDC058830]|uniref:aminotransferase class V-fold PLP-dependent enzyme n=1 Tax=Streptomyces sp. NPDC058830 TaxID=3346645 RepID=UPI00367DB822
MAEARAQVTEHSAVLGTCPAPERLHGARVTVLPVEGDGLVETTALAAAFTADTVLISVMAANNETGALQPVAELAALARERGAPSHCEAARTVGKIPLDGGGLGVDVLTVVGLKMYAPKGAAAPYVRDEVRLEPVATAEGRVRPAGRHGERRPGRRVRRPRRRRRPDRRPRPIPRRRLNPPREPDHGALHPAPGRCHGHPPFFGSGRARPAGPAPATTRR